MVFVLACLTVSGIRRMFKNKKRLVAIKCLNKINEWNKLSTECVTASSVNMLKTKVDTNLKRAGYT